MKSTPGVLGCAPCVRTAFAHCSRRRPNPHEPRFHHRYPPRSQRRARGDRGRLPDLAHRIRDPRELRALPRSDDGRERVVAPDLRVRDGGPEPVMGYRRPGRRGHRGPLRSRAGDRFRRCRLRRRRCRHGGGGQRTRAPVERRHPRRPRGRVHLVLARARRHRAGRGAGTPLARLRLRNRGRLARPGDLLTRSPSP